MKTLEKVEKPPCVSEVQKLRPSGTCGNPKAPGASHWTAACPTAAGEQPTATAAAAPRTGLQHPAAPPAVWGKPPGPGPTIRNDEEKEEPVIKTVVQTVGQSQDPRSDPRRRRRRLALHVRAAPPRRGEGAGPVLWAHAGTPPPPLWELVRRARARTAATVRHRCAIPRCTHPNSP